LPRIARGEDDDQRPRRRCSKPDRPALDPVAAVTAHGRYLVCDHYLGADGMTNDALYMTVAEQRRCLEQAGFDQVENVLAMRGLALHRARIGALSGAR
jgi:hypothetical protein